MAPPAAGGARPGGWTLAGAFLGVLLGGLLSMGALVFLGKTAGWPRLPLWLEALLFFGGPLSGIVLGGILGHRIQAARARR